MTSLAIILASFWTLGGATLTVQGKMYTNLDLSDVAFTENLLFESPSATPGHCALLCNRRVACESFTFDDNHCKGHDIQVNSTPSVSAPGARTFGRKGNPGSSRLHEATTPGPLPDWLGTACTSDSDCLDTGNAECFKGKCLCTPGFFYSVGSRTCVATCNDLQFTYTLYPGSVIMENNMYWKLASTGCPSHCNADPNCLNWDCVAFGDSCKMICSFYNVTALDVPDSWNPDNDAYNDYQRNCA